MTILGEQASALERDIQRMYDGWFIETCDEWLVPYIGDLLGLPPSQIAIGDPGTETGQRLQRVLSARRAVADAIALRRRKGTLWVLEEIAEDVAHWPARAVEFYPRIIASAHVDHFRAERAATVDIHSAARLLDVDTPFEDVCHTTNVRRINNENPEASTTCQA